MTPENSKVTIHMVSSLDGFIAKEDGDVSWLHSKDNYPGGRELSQQDIEAFLKGIDCYVMGSRTYEQALDLGWPYGDIPVTVLSHKSMESQRESVEFYSGNLGNLINNCLKPKFSNIWMVGGAKLCKDLLRLQLADQLIISIMPVILGGGTLFFDYIGKQQFLHLTDVTTYKDGMVELSYEIKKDIKPL